MSGPGNQARGRWDRHHLIAIGIYGIGTAGWCVVASTALAEYAHSLMPPVWLFPAVVLLVACPLAQAWLVWRIGLPTFALRLWESRRACVRRMLVGAAITYLAALAIGPRPQLAWLWLAMLSLWQTCQVLLLTVSPSAVDRWRRSTPGRRFGYGAVRVYATLLMLFLAEGVARMHHWASDWQGLARLATPEARSTFPTISSASISSTSMSSAGTAKFGLFDRLQTGRFRVALVGNNPAAARLLAARVRQHLPGAEIVPLEMPWSGPRCVREARREIEQSACDLVLVLVSICEDLAHEPAGVSAFDWRQLALARYIDPDPAVSAASNIARAPQDYETHLGQLSQQLSACQTPLTETMQRRWRQKLVLLDRLAAGSQLAEVPLALVVVPSEFQFNAALRQTLLRRSGLSAEQCDVELPQRRLASYADGRRLPMVDLLPHLRSCDEAVFHLHDSHLNEHGNRTAAVAISGWLASRYGDQLVAQLSKAP